MKTVERQPPKSSPKLGRSAVSGQYVLEPAIRVSPSRSAEIRDAVRRVVNGRRG
jgi:hypothetical protein